MSAETPAQFIGEFDGKKWYVASGPQFARQGLFFWDGTENIYVEDALASTPPKPAAEDVVESIVCPECNGHGRLTL